MEIRELLIEALRAGIRGEKVNWEQLTIDDWQALLELAQRQHVMPLLVEAVYGCPAFLALPQVQQREFKMTAVHIGVAQTQNTARFLQLYKETTQAGINCLVMKGIACRQLYPEPSLRPSSDEDILVNDADFSACYDYFLQRGMIACGERLDFECGFRSQDGLYIELHRSPFSPDAYEMGDSNAYFNEAISRAMSVTIEGTAVRTLNGHDHLLYLLLHAYKHFIHSGFGIRQVCDIILWAEQYGQGIDWQRLFAQCEELHCRTFAVAVFQIGQTYLDFNTDLAELPHALIAEKTPADKLLEDILCGGVYGGEELSRKHSGAVTVQQVRANRGGATHSLWQTAFPDRRSLQSEYPYLEQHPILLPAAWCQRLWRYGKELGQRKDSDAGEVIRLSQQRSELFRELRIIE